MVRITPPVKSITADGGGEGDATGNVLVYTVPTNWICRIKAIHCATRANAAQIITIGDIAAAATNMPTPATLRFNISASSDVDLGPDKIPNKTFLNGIVCQASAGTGDGVDITFELDVVPCIAESGA